MKIYYIAIFLAVIAALSQAVETPFSSLLLMNSTPIMTSSFLFFGAGIGIGIFTALTKKKTINPERHVQKSDIPTLLIVIIGDLAGVILLMWGLKLSSASSASSAALLQNFILVATAFVARIFFKEKISKRLWAAILLITLGCMALSVGDITSFNLNSGLILVLLFCLCKGITYNVRKKLTDRNSVEISIIRGFSIGSLALIIALISGEPIPEISIILLTMLIGVSAYGICNVCILLSQRHLGTTMSTAIFGLYPIISATISFILFHQTPTLSFAIALLLLIPGFYMVVTKNQTDEQESYAHPEVVKDKYNSAWIYRLSNYLVSLGFIIIAAHVMLRGFNQFEYLQNFDINILDGTSNLELCCGIFLILIASILIIIRKQEFSAISFMFFGMICIHYSLLVHSLFYMIYVAGFEILLAIIFLFSKSHKRIIYFLIFLLEGCFNLLLVNSFPYNEIINSIMTIILASYLLYLAFISAGIRDRLPFAKTLLQRESVDFKKCGSMMFYLIFAYTIIPWIFIYLTNNIIAYGIININIMTLIGAGFLALIAILLMIIRSSGFTSFIFLSTAFILALFSQLSGPYIYVIGILLFLLGLYAAIRPKSHLLLSLLYFLNGITAFASISISGNVELQFIQVLLNLITALISIYLAFAIFSTRVKLPLF